MLGGSDAGWGVDWGRAQPLVMGKGNKAWGGASWLSGKSPVQAVFLVGHRRTQRAESTDFPPLDTSSLTGPLLGCGEGPY